jgi:hypothetical protein
VKQKPHQSVLVALLLVFGFSMVVAGCMGGGTDTTTTLSLGPGQQSTQASASTQVRVDSKTTEADALSTFKPKDPFIQQAVIVSTTSTTSSVSPSTTGPSPSTTYHPGTTTTYHGGSTTTLHVTTTTSPHRHTLKILSVGDVGGSPAVTFQVDNSIYKDKRKGDVVSTSWGQVKVLDLSTSSKVATLLHGSETLVLTVGQLVFD